MNGKIKLLLPSPLQKIEHPLFREKKLSVFFKRDDLIHPLISGNKWRKLKYNISAARQKGILTFGGAFSNHIHATSIACNHYRKNGISFIRGERTHPLNSTLSLAEEYGMKLIFISRKEYAEKKEHHFLERVKKEYPNYFIIQEGAANSYGVIGCKEIIDEINLDFDYILSAVGTGATIAGQLHGLNKKQKAIGISVLKNAYSLEKEIEDLFHSTELDSPATMSQMEFFHDYHFGGYAKIDDELIEFMRTFNEAYQIKTDPVYSGKSLFALFDLIKKGHFPENKTIIYYHCGGLQGIEGMEKRYKFKLYP